MDQRISLKPLFTPLFKECKNTVVAGYSFFFLWPGILQFLSGSTSLGAENILVGMGYLLQRIQILFLKKWAFKMTTSWSGSGMWHFERYNQHKTFRNLWQCLEIFGQTGEDLMPFP